LLCENLTRILAAAVFLIAVCWSVGIASGTLAIRAETPFAFVLAALSLLLLSTGTERDKVHIGIARILAVAVAAFGIWQIEIKLQAGLNFMFLGAALSCLSARNGKIRALTPLAALFTLASATVGILSLTYGVSALAPFSRVSLLDMVLFHFMAVALFLAHRSSGPPAVFFEPAPGGTLARLLLLPVVIVVPYTGLLTGLGAHHEKDLTILLLLMNFGFPVVLWVTACALQRLEASRLRAYDELYAAHQSLNKELGEVILAQADLRQALTARSEFLAKVSHELRTPLAAIMGVLELVHGQSGNDLLKTAQDAAKDLLRLIGDILDFASIENRHIKLMYSDVDVRSLIASVVQTLKTQAGRKDVKLYSAVSDEVPYWICADTVRLRQVLFNLVDNALKFTESGQVSVEVDLEVTEPGKLLKFAVKDTGPGIPEQQQTVIFRPFAQADNSMTRKFGGIGLGLSICKELVELMGGDIGVEAREGTGSTFWFHIPLEPSARPAAQIETG